MPRSEPTKKLDILARREITLRHAIAVDGGSEKLARAAEAVRVAKLNVIKARMTACNDGKGLHTKIQPGAKITEELNLWSDIATPDIVAMYQEVKSLGEKAAP